MRGRIVTALRSALFNGRVAHCRLRPHRHNLAYRVFWLLLDLDEIDDVSARCRLFSRNRFNLFGFCDRDYGDGSDRPLKTQIAQHLAKAGIALDDGSIRVLTMPRILGYAFNPLSVYFCYQATGGLAAIVYEVNNTFGQRHTYVAPVTDGEASTIRQRCAKRFYVSPFMEMTLDYVFRVIPPRDRVVVSISGIDANGPVLGAVLSADRAELTDRTLARAAIVYPLLTIKVIAGIYWEALLLWLKGLRPLARPPAPDHCVTIARQTPIQQRREHGLQ